MKILDIADEKDVNMGHGTVGGTAAAVLDKNSNCQLQIIEISKLILCYVFLLFKLLVK
jgi:hypothetical protein